MKPVGQCPICSQPIEKIIDFGVKAPKKGIVVCNNRHYKHLIVSGKNILKRTQPEDIPVLVTN